MADKNVKIAGPTVAFSTAGQADFEAACTGNWTAAEKDALKWTVRTGDGDFAPFGKPGTKVALPIRSDRWGYACELRVSLGDTEMAKHTLVVIGLSTRPYAALTAPIDAASIREELIAKRKTKRSLARVGKTSYSIGEHLPYDGAHLGLGLGACTEGPHYRGQAFTPLLGHWAMIIEATTRVEGGQTFAAANTYDAAGVTFGLVQFAGNAYGANLILLLRGWLARTDAAHYFPKLMLKEVDGEDRIHGADGTLLDTPADRTNAALLKLLNPDPGSIDKVEETTIASLIHLSRHDPSTCLDQVELAVENFKRYMRDFHGDGIDKRPDYICAVVCDIRNQGRATKAAISACLMTGTKPVPDKSAYEALLRLKGKNDKYAKRVAHLKNIVEKMRKDGLLGIASYDEASEGFIFPNASIRTKDAPQGDARWAAGARHIN